MQFFVKPKKQRERNIDNGRFYKGVRDVEQELRSLLSDRRSMGF